MVRFSQVKPLEFYADSSHRIRGRKRRQEQGTEGLFVMSSKLKNSSSEPASDSMKKKKKERGLEIDGYRIEGLSIGGHETCVIFPTLNLAFDIGRCPPRAVAQEFVFISHGHMDHIGGLPMYVATRGLYSMKPPTIIVPKVIKEHVERLFEVHREIDQSELKHNLVGLDVGEEFCLRKDLKVRAFKTYHVVPSQGYVVYLVKQKLKQEYIGLSGNEIKDLKLSGVEITNTITSPEIAFTGDTMADFVVDPANADVLKARILVMECTFVDNAMTVDHAREYGHTHLSEIIKHSERFENKAILLIHFSARYQVDEIKDAVSKMPAQFTGRVFTLTEGF
ncbi:tRNA 3' processing endoribonuclease [Ancistrocladus abbreviatus]